MSYSPTEPMATAEDVVEVVEIQVPPCSLGINMSRKRGDPLLTVKYFSESSPLVNSVQVGDQLVSVDGTDLHGMATPDVNALLLSGTNQDRTLVFRRVIHKATVLRHQESDGLVPKTMTKSYLPEETAPIPIVQRDDVKRGAKCCGCCCDFRRAVIICNIVLFFFNVFAIIILAVGGSSLWTGSGYDDDFFDKYVRIFIAFEVIGLIMCGVAIYGAYSYNVILVGIGAAWIAAEFIGGLSTGLAMCADWEDNDTATIDYQCSINPFGIIVSAAVTVLWIYPHVGFIMEVKKGILSEETYPREQYSCCCV